MPHLSPPGSAAVAGDLAARIHDPLSLDSAGLQPAEEVNKHDDPGGAGELPRGASIGRYLVLNRLGSGAMGMVYAAYDPELNRKLAINLLRPSLSAVLLAVCMGAAPAGAPQMPPLPPGAGLVRVPGFLPAVVAWPAGETSRPLPVVVAAHGSFDQPEWNCAVYQQVVRGSAVVLCPRGRLRWDSPAEPELLRYFYPSTGGSLGREIEAALRVLKASSPGRIADGPMLYVGFSQGAIFGATLLIAAPAHFPRAILVEGGHGAWNASTARRYAQGGGKRILFACGRASCLSGARAAVAHLARAGVGTRVVYAPDQGHVYDGGVQNEVSGAFAWLVEDDPRFTFPPAGPPPK